MRINRIPMRYDNRLAKFVVSLLPWVVILQLSTACYQFSTPISAITSDGEGVEIWTLPDWEDPLWREGIVESVLYVSNPFSERLGRLHEKFNQDEAEGMWLFLVADVLPRIIRTNVSTYAERPPSGAATERSGHIAERPPSGAATERSGHRAERPPSGAATERSGQRAERPDR
jgi:hypothetical protein